MDDLDCSNIITIEEACIYNNPLLVEKFLQHPQISPRAFNCMKKAVYCGNYKIMKILIKDGRDLPRDVELDVAIEGFFSLQSRFCNKGKEYVKIILKLLTFPQVKIPPPTFKRPFRLVPLFNAIRDVEFEKRLEYVNLVNKLRKMRAMSSRLLEIKNTFYYYIGRFENLYTVYVKHVEKFLMVITVMIENLRTRKYRICRVLGHDFVLF